MDIMLYIACHRLDARLVATLLDQGANPDISFSGDESDTARDRIAGEASYMDTVVYHLYEASPSKRKSISIEDDNIYNLLNFGAHEQIYNLILGHRFIS